MPSKLIGLIVSIAGGLGCTPAEQGLEPRNEGSFHEAMFPIESGAHAGTDCNQCHGGFDTFKDFSCIRCHDHAQDTTDAIHEGLTDYVYNDRSCFDCHARGQGAPDIDHAAYFPIGQGTSHDMRCISCHPQPQDRRVVDCIGCHDHAQAPMATRHEAVSDYQWDTTSCIGCHRDGAGLSRTDHDAIFAISSGTPHQDTACNRCHMDAGQKKNVTCVGCHPHESDSTQAVHRDVGGYRFESGLCLACHAESPLFRVAQHRPFRIDRQAEHGPDQAACLRCHEQRRSDKPFAADFMQFGCAPCHSRADMDDEHGDVSGYRFEPRTCVMSGCHPDGQEADD